VRQQLRHLLATECLEVWGSRLYARVAWPRKKT